MYFFFLTLLIKVSDDGSDLLKQEAEFGLALESGAGRYTSFILTNFLTYSMEHSSS